MLPAGDIPAISLEVAELLEAARTLAVVVAFPVLAATAGAAGGATGRGADAGGTGVGAGN